MRWPWQGSSWSQVSSTGRGLWQNAEARPGWRGTSHKQTLKTLQFHSFHTLQAPSHWIPLSRLHIYSKRTDLSAATEFDWTKCKRVWGRASANSELSEPEVFCLAMFQSIYWECWALVLKWQHQAGSGPDFLCSGETSADVVPLVASSSPASAAPFSAYLTPACKRKKSTLPRYQFH